MTGIGITIAFWIFALLAVGMSIGVIAVKDPLKSAFLLVGVFFSTAAEFLLLHASFIAVLQILIYAGAIMVFVIFVIMLINLRPENLGRPRRTITKALAVIIAAALGITMLIAGYQTFGAPEVTGSFGGASQVAEILYSRYSFAFEALSLLLLIAVVGAVTLSGNQEPKQGADR